MGYRSCRKKQSCFVQEPLSGCKCDKSMSHPFVVVFEKELCVSLSVGLVFTDGRLKLLWSMYFSTIFRLDSSTSISDIFILYR